jgi:HTH-type transcriptional regulator, competence development regulator
MERAERASMKDMGGTLATVLRQIRGVSGASLREVERKTGISNAYLSQLESGAATRPSPQVLHKLATFYSVPYESLMEAAGYLEPARDRGGPLGRQRKRLGTLQAALMSAKLTDEEQARVAEFIEFLCSKREKE